MSRPLKWAILSTAMRTVGRASAGVDLGYRRGFDSGEMLDYVYENKPRGNWLVGPFIDSMYLKAIGWRAIRERKTLLKETLSALLDRSLEAKAKAVLLDVAAGPGRYLLELLRERGLGPERLDVVCRDLDAAGLGRGRALAAAWGIANVRYEQGDACSREGLQTVSPRPDIVVASGLYELLEPSLIQASMEGIHSILPSGGHVIFTTQVAHPQLELISNVLPNRFGQSWRMVCHSVPEAEGWAREAGFSVEISEIEPLGLFAVTVARK